MNDDNDNVYLKIGKLMYENIFMINMNQDYIIINSKSFDDYRKEYIIKLNVQIELLEKSLNKIDYEIEELERKNLELFISITKNIKLKYNKYIRINKSFNFNILNFGYSLESEKYKLNNITIDKLKNDRNLIFKSLENTKSYRLKYDY